MIAGAMRLGDILDDMNPVCAGHLHDRRHLAGPAGQMYGENRASAFRNGRRECCRTDIAAVRLHVAEDRGGAAHHRGAGRGDKAPRGHDDFIAGADAQRIEGQLKGHGAVGHRDGMLTPEIFGILPFKGAAGLSVQ